MAKDDLPDDNLHEPVVDDDAPGPPISVPDSNDTGEGGKLKMIVQLVKKCLGVKDIATMRLSLPASLLEPVPNLEYWHYLDRPDLFAALSTAHFIVSAPLAHFTDSINDSEFPFERMLAAVRFAFTKDLKFVHGKVCKPYNSVLGEHFRAHWDVPPVAYSDDQTPVPLTHTTDLPHPATFTSETASIRSGKSSKSARSRISAFSKGKTSTPATSIDANTAGSIGGDDSSDRLRVVYVTEQVSHHPPVSAYFASCPKSHIELFGIDQISAKVSGTTLKVSPGQYNQGIFVNITGGCGEGERYHITHPVASVNGILRGSFYVTVSESTIVTCTGGKSGAKFRAVIEYKEESWLGRAHFLVEGVIHIVHEGDTNHEEWTKVKHVPANRVVATFDGSWRGQIRWRRVGGGSYPNALSSSASSPSPSHEHLPMPEIPSHAASRTDVAHSDTEYMPLIDLSKVLPIPKDVRPLEKQLPHESRKLWESVTSNLLKKEFSEATREKVAIEQKQRDTAAEWKRKGIEFAPRYFEKDMSAGYANLTEEGRKAVQEELVEPSAAGVEA